MSGRPINALELYARTMQPIKERLGLLPFGQYEDGSVRLAVPGMVADAWSGGRNVAETAMPAINDDDAWARKAADSFDAAGLAVTGGLGVGLAGGLADNAVGSAGGKLAPQSQPQSVKAYRGTIRPDELTPKNGNPMWLTPDPDVASNYAMQSVVGTDWIPSPTVAPVEARFQNPYVFDAGGARFDELKSPMGARTDAVARGAQELGHDGLIINNVLDLPEIYETSLPSTTVAALRPGTVYSATTGELLYSNAPSGSSVPLAMNALERAGAELPMDLASRMARAREMGFDTDQVLYHGTGKTFDEFNPGTRGNGRARNIYLTDNPEIADIYANSPNYGLKGGGDPMIYPVFAKSEKPLVVSDRGPDGSFGWVSDNLAAALGVGQPPPGKYGTLYDEARRQGYDQVQIREMTDLGGPQTQYIPLKPEYIRSVNAAFDPSKSDSANLLAANPLTASAVPLAGETQDTDPALLEYLRLTGQLPY